MWSGFVWFRLGADCRHLRTRQRTFRYRKMRGVSWLPEELLGCLKGPLREFTIWGSLRSRQRLRTWRPWPSVSPCVREREREYWRVCVCVRERKRVLRVCVREGEESVGVRARGEKDSIGARARVCVCEGERKGVLACVCVCVRERERERKGIGD